MIDDDTPPTELQISQSTGVRCFLVSPNHFDDLATQIEAPRKLDMVHTMSSFRPAASYPVSLAGKIMVRCRGNQISAADDTLIAQAITSGIIEEVTVAEFAALLPHDTSTP